ncbi:MAG TPA: VWA domain-containing protein [Bryobacteraceae bacterium]|nr:VWA domain-containing protein [Bryobacteraceae bacterium]
MLPLLLLSLLSFQKDEDFKIRADVQQVVLPVTVTDRRGGFVSGLNESDFTVYEDGKPRKIAFFSSRDVPVTVGLVVDNSSSMRPRRVATNLAALNFIRLSNPQDEAFVVNFNDRVSFPLQDPFTSDREQLRSALSTAQPGGKTALYDAILASLEHLSNAGRDRKALIVISDGGDTASRLGFRDVLEKARASHASIYTIVLIDPNDHDPAHRPDLMAKLARATGGESYRPESMQALFDACGQIARELRCQYTIAYTPDPPSQEGRYRGVRVTVRAPGRGRLEVRTRPGYYAPAANSSAARSGQ